MASASNNPPLPPPPPETTEVLVHNATLVSTIPVNVDAATPVAATSSITTAKDFSFDLRKTYKLQLFVMVSIG